MCTIKAVYLLLYSLILYDSVRTEDRTEDVVYVILYSVSFGGQ